MLTINADADPLFRDNHQADREKRVVVILPEGAYSDGLTAQADESRDFLVPFPSDKLVAMPMACPHLSAIYCIFIQPYCSRIMLCSVARTHHLGQKRRDNDPAPTVTGTVHMYSITREDLRRQVRVMTMDGLAKFGATAKGSILDLLEPELLTFCSNRGMMVCGFEEIGGRRYYQGCWMQWILQ